MKITKNHLRKIIKEEVANALEEVNNEDLEEGWWPFGKEEEHPVDKKRREKREKKEKDREKARQKVRYDKARAAAEKKAGITKRRDDEREAKEKAKMDRLKPGNARYDAEQKKKRQKEMDAEYDEKQRGAKRKEDEKNKIEHWEFDDGRGSMAVAVNDPESVAKFHRANGTEIPEWALRALKKSRF